MPRGPRLDVEGAEYHVMAPGVERRAIFRDDRDRQNFLRQLEAVAEEEDLVVFAYVLMDNHFHVVAPRMRPVEVSRYLGVSRAAITAQLRAHDT